MIPPRRASSARDVLARAMPEYAWQALVIDIAHVGGFTVAHFRPAQNAEGRWRTPVGAEIGRAHV